MVTVLLGEDSFAKAQFLEQLLAKIGQQQTRYQDSDSMPNLASLGGNDLFGTSQTYVFSDCLKHYESEAIEQAAQSNVQIIFLEDSLDKRLNKTKKILQVATVQEFPAPIAVGSSAWIINHAKSLKINIEPNAANELAIRLMGDTKMTLPVVQCHHELLKLAAFTNGQPITIEVVQQLTPQDVSIDLFKLLDHIGNHQKSQAMHLLQRYYEASSEDEKALTIRLVALLSDQVRNLLLTKQMQTQRMSDPDILQQTGWKSGRLFIMKKLSAGFRESQLVSALNKFYNLDKELKSSTLPPRVIVDMIVAAL